MNSGAWTAVGTIALAVVTVAAVITSIVITTQDRRRADEALERAARREEDTWRRALHQECWQNIDLGKEPPDGLWSFDVGVLRESSIHAAAFPKEVLQRIIWARTANEHLEARLTSLRAGEPVLAGTLAAVQQLRAKVLGEISEIEKQLRH